MCVPTLLDVTSVAVASNAGPTIGQDLALRAVHSQWVVSAYGLTFAGFLLVGGRIADLWGRRAALVAGLAVFAAGACAAGLAPTGGVLVLARALMGLGSALCGPAALSLLGQMFPAEPARGRAVGTYAAAGALGFTGGLVGGGLLVDVLGWRWSFLALLPVCLLAAGAALSVLPAGGRRGRGTRLGTTGAILGTAGLTFTAVAVTDVAAGGASAARVSAVLGLAAAALALFAVAERRSRFPLVPRQVLRSMLVRVGAGTAALLFSAGRTMLFLAPLHLQVSLGYSAAESGLALVPMGLLITLSGFLTGRMLPRTGLRAPLVTGQLVLAAGLAGVAVGVHAGGLGTFLAGSALVGVGQGIAFPALTAASLTGLRQVDLGAAGGLNLTAQQLGGGIGVALLVSLTAAGGSAGEEISPAGHAWALGPAAALTVLGAVGAHRALSPDRLQAAASVNRSGR